MGEIPSLNIINNLSALTITIPTNLSFLPTKIFVQIYLKETFVFWAFATTEQFERIIGSGGDRMITQVTNISKKSFDVYYRDGTSSTSPGFVSGMKIKWIAVE